MTKILFFDTETGGLLPQHALLQLSGIIDINGKVVHTFDFFIKPFPDDLVDDSALEITGFTREQIQGFEEPLVVKDKLMKIFETYINRYDKNDKFILSGHNVHFDITMLSSWFKKCGEQYYGAFIDMRRKFDTLAILQGMRILKVLPDSPNNKLCDVCEEYGIVLEKAHNSMYDIEATRELAYVLGRLIKKNLKGQEVF